MKFISLFCRFIFQVLPSDKTGGDWCVTKCQVSPSYKLSHRFLWCFWTLFQLFFFKYWIYTHLQYNLVSNIGRFENCADFNFVVLRQDRQSKSCRKNTKSTKIMNESSLKERLRSIETNFKMLNMILFFYSVGFVAGTCENNGFVSNWYPTR